ncbi:MAG TPA: tyrosine--tRNA ligase [Caulobacteraceae bacterium]|nr:tyrosine--tRNA ligase [Caulobacteraceae bacterium]
MPADAEFKPKSDFLRVMRERGYIHQITDAEALDKALTEGVVTTYVGYDCTNDSLHIGHLISIMMLRWLQKCGHRPITLMGGGTTKVGDPTDRDQQRPLLSDAVIDANLASIRKTFAKFLTFGDGPADAIMVNNADWLEKLGYVEFLREYGVHFTINRMLAFDSVKLRLEREQPMSFLEFNYMLMQATDFLQLARRHGCTLQMGGSDQWGNIINGVELNRRMDARQAFGLTTPLLATASGEKMGKTVGGAVWLNADRLSPYDYWQMWRNTEDADVGRFLKLFTELPLPEIARLAALRGSEINEAKKVLASEATALLHGAEAAQAAADASRAAFEEGRLSEDLPTRPIDRAGWEPGRSNTEVVFASGLVSSKSEARKKINAGEVRVNDRLVTDPNAIAHWADLDPELGVFKVQLGKRGKIVLVKPA